MYNVCTDIWYKTGKTGDLMPSLKKKTSFMGHVSQCKLVCVCTQTSSQIRLFVIPWTVARQVPLSVEFSRQEY